MLFTLGATPTLKNNLNMFDDKVNNDSPLKVSEFNTITKINNNNNINIMNTVNQRYLMAKTPSRKSRDLNNTILDNDNNANLI